MTSNAATYNTFFDRLNARSLALAGVAILGIVAVGVGLRFASTDWPNVAPVAAAALYAGWLFRRVWLALLVPLAIMFITDRFIGGYDAGTMAVVYAAFCIPVVFRGVIGRKAKVWRVGGAMLACSLIFFVLTNAAVWFFDPWQIYGNGVGGLMASYAAGLPFLKYTILGDLAFACAFFGVHAAVIETARRWRSADPTVPARCRLAMRLAK